MSSSFQDDVEKSTPLLQLRSASTDFSRVPFRVLRDNLASSSNNILSPATMSPTASDYSTGTIQSPLAPSPASTQFTRSPSEEPHDRIALRHSILAALPIPTDIPDDALKPISIPAPFTLHEFLGNTTGVSRSRISA